MPESNAVRSFCEVTSALILSWKGKVILVLGFTPPYVHIARGSRVDVAAMIDALGRQGFVARSVEGTGMKSSEGMYTQLAFALNFPGSFGRNFDALQDCLTDLDWYPQHGAIILAIHDAEQFLEDEPDETMHILANVFHRAGQSWGGQRWSGYYDRVPTPFHVLLSSEQNESHIDRRLATVPYDVVDLSNGEVGVAFKYRFDLHHLADE